MKHKDNNIDKHFLLIQNVQWLILPLQHQINKA